MYRSEQGIRHLYMEVYEHYRGLILSEVLKSGDRMPSLRKASAELSRSRTTVESAYFQLAADGYIVARSRSGYYVTDIASARKSKEASGHDIPFEGEASHAVRPRYDFASSGVDRESFRFDLWQRYIKSALRQDERLLSYGEPQGEADFREALSAYVRDRRNILCSPEQIVVGAGLQTLLHLLCPLLRERHTVSVPTPSFVHGAAVFRDHGFDVHFRDKDADIIYVSPAHMNRLGEIMPVKRRMELIRYASNTGSLIIEDDYENEFVYLQKPTPSLYGLSREDNVVYIGSFSRLLLPSIRISFMILPFPLLEEYQKTAAHYNQTASKAEQIALAQFIRDGHLTAQIRRLRRLYAAKQQHLSEAAVKIFGSGCKVRNAPSGTMVTLSVPCKKGSGEISPEAIVQKAGEAGLRILPPEYEEGTIKFTLSCSSIPEEDFTPALLLLKEASE